MYLLRGPYTYRGASNAHRWPTIRYDTYRYDTYDTIPTGASYTKRGLLGLRGASYTYSGTSYIYKGLS